MEINMMDGDPSTFSRRLAELGEAGSTLLVVGGDAGPRDAVSSQLLGQPSRSRVPLFVLLGRDRSVVVDRSQRAGSIDDAQVIEFGFDRSASSRQPGTSTQGGRPLASLQTLREEITTAVEQLSSEPDEPFSPGELRVCLDSLSAIVDGFDRPSVEAFLGDLRTVVTDRNGIGHAILPVPSVPGRYDWLKASFDVVVETRSFDGVAMERWRLTDDGLATDWFQVDQVSVE